MILDSGLLFLVHPVYQNAWSSRSLSPVFIK